MTTEEIRMKLDAHRKWLERDRTGEGRADLSGAYLSDAYLRGANLSGAYLRGANLSDADLGAADVIAIPSIDQRIAEAVSAPGCSLEMDDWHKCATTHCRAGWAVHLAGEAGYALERQIGPAAAGALIIYAASRPGKPIPNFYADNETAMADILACAAD